MKHMPTCYKHSRHIICTKKEEGVGVPDNSVRASCAGRETLEGVTGGDKGSRRSGG